MAPVADAVGDLRRLVPGAKLVREGCQVGEIRVDGYKRILVLAAGPLWCLLTISCSRPDPSYTQSAQELADHFVRGCEEDKCDRSDFASHVDGEQESRRAEANLRAADSYDLLVIPSEFVGGARMVLTFNAAGRREWAQTLHLSNETGPWEIVSGTARNPQSPSGTASTDRPTP